MYPASLIARAALVKYLFRTISDRPDGGQGEDPPRCCFVLFCFGCRYNVEPLGFLEVTECFVVAPRFGKLTGHPLRTKTVLDIFGKRVSGDGSLGALHCSLSLAL